MLEHLEHLAQRTHIRRQVGHRQQVALAGNDHVVALGHRFAASLDRRMHQASHVVAQLAQFATEALAHAVERLAGKILVQVIGRLRQLRRRVVDIGQEQAVLDVATGIDDHEQDALFGQAQEFDLLEHRFAARALHHAGKLRQRREHLGRVGDQLLRMLQRQAHALGADRRFIELFDGQQGVDKHAVAARRRNPAGRGVGTGDEAHVLEVGHDVADRRGRQFQARQLGQRARADRLAVGNIAFDKRFEQGLGTVIELHGSGKRLFLWCWDENQIGARHGSARPAVRPSVIRASAQIRVATRAVAPVTARARHRASRAAHRCCSPRHRAAPGRPAR